MLLAKLLGDEEHGRWKIAPKGSHRATHRRYRGESLVLESEFVTPEGTVRVVDCMPIRQEHPEVVRLVEGVRGRVSMRMDLTIRFGYGQIVPWVRRLDGTLVAIAGPDGLSLWTPVHTRGEDYSTVAEFTVSEGQRVPFSLAWFPASEEPPARSTPSTPSRTPRPGGTSGCPNAPMTVTIGTPSCGHSSR